MAKRFLLMRLDEDGDWMAVGSEKNINYIYPWYKTYEDAEKAMEEIIKAHPDKKEYDEEQWQEFFIFATKEAHEIDGHCAQDGEVFTTYRQAL